MNKIIENYYYVNKLKCSFEKAYFNFIKQTNINKLVNL